MADDLVKLSKFLSLVLRHKPEEIGLTLDANGWADADELIRLANRRGRPLDRRLLERVVAENDKKRFAFSDDGRQIRRARDTRSRSTWLSTRSSPPPCSTTGRPRVSSRPSAPRA